MVFFVTAFHNLGPSELAKFQTLQANLNCDSSGKYFGLASFGKSPKLEGEVNILQEIKAPF